MQESHQPDIVGHFFCEREKESQTDTECDLEGSHVKNVLPRLTKDEHGNMPQAPQNTADQRADPIPEPLLQ